MRPLVLAAVLAATVPLHTQLTPDPRPTPHDVSLLTPSASERAVHWMRTAADRALVLDLEGERRAWRRALKADPSSFQAQKNLLWHAVDPEERAALHEELRRIAAEGSDSAACLVAELDREPDGYRAVFEALQRLEKEKGRSLCLAERLAHWAGSRTPKDRWRDAELDYARRAAEAAEGPANIGRYARLLAREGRYEEARGQMSRAIREWDHPLARVGALMNLAEVHRLSGDSARARALVTAVRAAVDRDGRPGLRLHFLWDLEQSHRAQDRADSLAAIRRERVRLALENEHWRHALDDIYTLTALTGDVDSDERLALLDRGVRLADSVGWTERVAYLHFARGAQLRQRGELDRAEADLAIARTAAGRRGHPAIEVEILHNLLHVHEARGEYERASQLADEYIAAAERHMIPGARVMSRRDAGLVRWKAGWHAAGDSAFADMVRAIAEHGVYHNWAGEYYERIGRLEDALAAYRQASREDPAHQERRLALAGLARVYEALGHADSALAAARRHDAETMYAASFPLLPGLMVRQGRVEEALEIGRRWVEEGRERAQLPFLVEALLGLSDLQLQAEQFDGAARSAHEADSLALLLDRRVPAMEARILEGRALTAAGRPADALARLDDASGLLGVRPPASVHLDLAMARADAFAARGNLAGALDAYATAADAAERVAAELRQDPGRSRFRHAHQSPYDAALDLLLAEGERLGPRDTSTASRVAEWLQRRKSASFGVASRSRPLPVRLSELRRRLAEESALLDYFVTETEVAVLVVRSTGATVVRLPPSPPELTPLIHRLERPLTATYLGRLDLARAPFSTAAARGLHDALLAPAMPHLDGVESLYLVPDGVVHRIPFAALSAGPGRFLLDDFSLSYLPANDYLPDGRAREGSFAASPHVAAIGTDAPGWERELGAISDVWGDRRTRILEGPLATESSVRALRDVDLIHFAVHAEANRRDPLASHLRLVADAAHDGFLHFNEIGETGFDAELVVLSACESTGGTVFRGEGAMSLARVFLRSGSRSVVASLWPVGPLAAPLMARFHRELAAGRAPRDALRAAQQAMRGDPETAHTFHWASFVLIEGG